MGWYGGWGSGLGWGGWLGMGLMMLVFWGLLVAGVVWLVRSTTAGRAGERAVASDPLRLLDERFARGEVTEEEYRRRRELLRSR